ncbi:MAG: HAD family hydrolase [Bacilli bacterium]|jgi:phosphoglycolate phosphatase|nr:HAD family hydrolase [Bacilli bacterium]MCH4210174.1 HAD family hydrolase [Bacilli bacterium]
MKSYDVYLFDFDGTLFDTLDSLVGVYKTALRSVGYDCTKEDAAKYMHMSLSETADLLHIDDPASRNIFFEKTSEALDYPEYIKMIKMFPDVLNTLKALAKKKKIIGIVSGNTEKHISLVLNQFGIKDYFSFAVGSAPGRRPKPFADPILFALRSIPTVSPKKVVYIGDSLQDPETAKNAGVDGVLLDRNHEHVSYKGKRIATLKTLLPK